VAKVPDSACSIERTLGVLGERWTFLVLREAFEGATRFAEFKQGLRIASDVLSERLATLVAHGVMQKVEYQEPGERRRAAYELTEAGRELIVVLAALQQWGDRHLPRPDGPSLVRRDRRSGSTLSVGFIDPEAHEVAPADVTFVPTDAYPRERLARREELAARKAQPVGS
jgi:DNA-binding HxlR family transcriptional regulator